jgi:uridine phosphorylase
MPFPVHPGKFDSEPVLTAADIVAYRARLGRTPGLHAAKSALFCLERGLPRRLRWRIPVRRVGSMNATLHETKRTKYPVAILTDFGGGAPIVAELAEELVAMGLKKLILMTWGGALQPDLKPGDIVVCERAVRDEGVSQHYLSPGKFVEADAALAAQLTSAIRSQGAACTTGITWTTDAPYRETRAEVRHFQGEGVKVVEMESSGLFTIGQVRGVATASVVVVMDSLATLTWTAPDRLKPILRSLETVYAAALEVLAE